MHLKAKAAFLHADDWVVASTYLVWLQTAFDTLEGLFVQLGLKKNVKKTMGMVCHPFQAAKLWADEAYT